MSKIATFTRGGTHPPENKELCDASHYTILPNPAELVIALAQHLGGPAKPVVKTRDHVESGQLVGEASGFVSVNIHTPLPGTIRMLDKVHLGPVNSPSVVVKVDEGAPTVPAFADNPRELDLAALAPEDVLARIKEAGITGMGGAAFPTHVKLTPPPGAKIDRLIINGAECEPYLTADDCLMRCHPLQVLEGTRAAMKVLGVTEALVGIEDNKPEAFRALAAAADGLPGITIQRIKTRYPQGSEKQLIEALTGRRVPPGKLPFSVGVIVQNVGTMAAVYEALADGRPLMRRLVSVSGRAVAKPQNVLVPMGTSVEQLLDYCGGLKDELAEVIIGGPMMGRTTSDISEPVTKGCSGVLFLTPAEAQVRVEQPCVRCGRCVAGCPMGLQPTQLMNLAQMGRFDDALDALDCIECGTCAFVCPSSRQLVHWIRLLKWEINRQRRRKQAREKQQAAAAAKS